MLVVLTSEREIENEGALLNQLFSAGLEVLHLRKPTLDKTGYTALLHTVEQQYHNRIVTHQFHELCNDFRLKGIHLQEQPRLDLGEKLETYVNDFKDRHFSVSSSFHQPEVLAKCAVDFNYNLLSPVFASISKAGYEGKGFDVNAIPKIIIGMGGINDKTIEKTFDLGYKGIGVLGGVWNVDDPVDSFKRIKVNYDALR